MRMDKNLVTTIGSALEYLHGRGEFDDRLERVVTKTRYTDDEVHMVDVYWDGKRVRISCEEIR